MGAPEFTYTGINNEFIAAVLEGVENTLEELIERVQTGFARDQLSGLMALTATVRHSFEERVSARTE